MASRSSTSIGVGVTIGILSVLALAFFVVAAITYGKLQQKTRDMAALEAAQSDFVKDNERNRDDVRVLLDQAKNNGGQSLVGYLTEAYQTAMERTTGSRRDSLASFQEKLGKVQGADSGSLLSVVADRERTIADLQNQLAKSEADRTRALADLQAETERVRGIESRHGETVAALNGQVGTFRSEVDGYRDGINAARAKMDEQVSELRRQLADAQGEASREIARLQEENLILQNQVQVLRGDRTSQVLTAGDEAALVDGQIIAADGAERTATISLGASQRVVLGMTFSVYPDASAIRPNETTGEYPRGKAGLEVIRVAGDSATCRILWELRGNPVVPGDVIANPVYDPKKVYKFLAFGNFDVDADGIATPGEREVLVGIIESWGGRVVDDLGGDVDFLVLGSRPVLPPRPGPDAPIEVVQEYIRQDRIVQRYDRLYQQAGTTSLPILNENRLFTLLGRERVPPAE